MKERFLFRLRRIAAVVLLAVMLCAGVFATAFIAHAAGHDCSGHDCPVCHFVTVCKSNLQLLGAGFAPAPVSVAAAALVFAALRVPKGRRPERITPVVLKVRLNL